MKASKVLIDQVHKYAGKNHGIILMGSMILSAASFNCGTEKNIAIQDSLSARTEDVSVFHIKLDTEGCDVALDFTREFTMTTDVKKDIRKIVSNNIPNHNVGAFPNPGNPNTITPQAKTYNLDLTPALAKNITPGQGLTMGVLLSGAEIEPYSGEFFIGSEGDLNRRWNYNVLNTAIDLGTDCNNAHVQPTGNYHYHGTPNAYLETLGVDASEMVKIGYAADGFPIYYKYALDENGILKEYQSGYTLKSGDRAGDNITSPSGCFDGRFFQDYEYQSELSELDQCNGRYGQTPESEGEYYYIITDNFPSAPLCLSGTPSDDFKKGAGGPPPLQASRTGKPQRRGPGNHQRSDPTTFIQSLDKDGDGKVSKDETSGPLRNDFNRVDLNRDGFITKEEFEKAPPPDLKRRSQY